MLPHPAEPPPAPVPPVAELSRGATVALGMVAAGFVAAYAVLPGQRAWLAAGGGLVDLVTPFVLALAVVAAAWGVRHTPGARRSSWPLVLGGILGFLDEIHYASGILGYQPPQVGPVTVDGSSAALDAARYYATTTLGLGTLDMVAALLVVLAGAAFLASRERRAARALTWLADHPPMIHLGIAVILVAVATGLDLFAKGVTLGFVEEWLEFVAAGVLLRGALLVSHRDPQVWGWRHRIRPWLEGEAPQRALPPAAAHHDQP
jgi:hypothetical protein